MTILIIYYIIIIYGKEQCYTICYTDFSNIDEKENAIMGAIKDLTGIKFGKLTVIKITPERKNRQVVWECLCDCGNTVYVVGQALRTGHTTSCGCSRKNCKNAYDLLGQRFSKLVVVERAGSNDRREALWKCKCDCGEYRVCTTHELTQMQIRSCINCKDYSSKGEETIANMLKQHGINYIREYTFKDLLSKNGYHLRFDFAIVDNFGQLIQLIEYDGSQHLKPEIAFGGEEGFKDLQERDNLKNEYCKKNNIPLIRITKDYRNLKYQDLKLNM